MNVKDFKLDKRMYINQKEMDFINFVLRSTEFNSEQKTWYQSKVITRINTLQPLVNECTEKNISFKDLDNDINNEWNRLIFLRNKYCL